MVALPRHNIVRPLSSLVHWEHRTDDFCLNFRLFETNKKNVLKKMSTLGKLSISTKYVQSCLNSWTIRGGCRIRELLLDKFQLLRNWLVDVDKICFLHYTHENPLVLVVVVVWWWRWINKRWNILWNDTSQLGFFNKPTYIVSVNTVVMIFLTFIIQGMPSKTKLIWLIRLICIQGLSDNILSKMCTVKVVTAAAGTAR